MPINRFCPCRYTYTQTHFQLSRRYLCLIPIKDEQCVNELNWKTRNRLNESHRLIGNQHIPYTHTINIYHIVDNLKVEKGYWRLCYAMLNAYKMISSENGRLVGRYLHKRAIVYIGHTSYRVIPYKYIYDKIYVYSQKTPPPPLPVHITVLHLPATKCSSKPTGAERGRTECTHIFILHLVNRRKSFIYYLGSINV